MVNLYIISPCIVTNLSSNWQWLPSKKQLEQTECGPLLGADCIWRPSAVGPCESEPSSMSLKIDILAQVEGLCLIS